MRPTYICMFLLLVPAPPENVAVSVAARTPTSILLIWNNPIDSRVSGFRIVVVNSSGNQIGSTIDLTSAEGRKKEIIHLSPGASYHFLVSTLSGNEESQAISVNATTCKYTIITLLLTSMDSHNHYQ